MGLHNYLKGYPSRVTNRLCNWLIHLLESFDESLVALDDDVSASTATG